MQLGPYDFLGISVVQFVIGLKDQTNFACLSKAFCFKYQSAKFNNNEHCSLSLVPLLFMMLSEDAKQTQMN